MDLICGINPVLEALTAGTRHFDRLLIVKGIRNQRVSDAISRASQIGVPLRFEARETLDRMAGGLPHQGIIAVVSAKPVIDVDQLLAEAREPALVVVLDGVEDPRNLGAILRSVESAGAAGVLLPERHSAGLSETVGRASAGALEHVRVARIGNVAQAIESLKARGLWIVGFDAAGTERWDSVDLRRPVALVLGGEGRGMRRLVRERCDHLVSLPHFGHVASLNVSVVAGIALYEAIRQRGAVPSHVKPIPLRPAAARKQVVAPGPEDREHDPGLLDPTDHGASEEDAEDAPVNLVRIDDEADWAGPTVLRGDGGSRYGHARRDRRPQDRGPRPQPQGAASPAEAVRSAGEGGKRRRRRRRDGPPHPQHAAGTPSPREAPVPPTPAEGAAPGGSHRKRRRRRRR
jgi:23S rRNA (guanosine2251-2'-O)-methyltransferase